MGYVLATTLPRVILSEFHKVKKKKEMAAEDPKLDLMKQIRSHEVAIAELNALSSSRTVYQKNGNLLFRTTIQKASASEQKQLDLAKASLGKLNYS